MSTKNIQKNRAFIILFTVVLASIILSIALGVLNIAFREVKFGTSAKNSNDAFFAADTGAECALYHDKASGSVFVEGGGTEVSCLGETFDLSGSFPSWSFVLSGLGPEEKGCAKITVIKDDTDPENILTQIVAKGYNTGGSVAGACNPGPNSLERALELNY